MLIIATAVSGHKRLFFVIWMICLQSVVFIHYRKLVQIINYYNYAKYFKSVLFTNKFLTAISHVAVIK